MQFVGQSCASVFFVSSIYQAELSSNDRCATGSESESYEDDTVVFCDRCDVAVHQLCYAIAVLPKVNCYCDSWRRYLGSNSNSSTTVSCTLFQLEMVPSRNHKMMHGSAVNAPYRFRAPLSQQSWFWNISSTCTPIVTHCLASNAAPMSLLTSITLSMRRQSRKSSTGCIEASAILAYAW